MKYTDKKQLSQLNIEQLKTKKAELQKDLFGFCMQKGFGELGQAHVKRETKRDIARVNTFLHQRQSEKR